MHVYTENLLSDYVPTGKNIILWIFWSHIWEDAEMIWNVKLIRNITSVLLLNYSLRKQFSFEKLKIVLGGKTPMKVCFLAKRLGLLRLLAITSEKITYQWNAITNKGKNSYQCCSCEGQQTKLQLHKWKEKQQFGISTCVFFFIYRFYVCRKSTFYNNRIES